MSIRNFEEGKVYQSKTHGMVEYVGLDVYFGQTTYHFRSLTYNTSCYWLPETLDRHFEKE